MPLQIEERFCGNVFILQCTGHIVLGEELNALAAVFDRVIREFHRIVLNLAAVTRLDSSGMGLIVRYTANLRKRNGDVAWQLRPTSSPNSSRSLCSPPSSTRTSPSRRPFSLSSASLHHPPPTTSPAIASSSSTAPRTSAPSSASFSASTVTMSTRRASSATQKSFFRSIPSTTSWSDPARRKCPLPQSSRRSKTSHPKPPPSSSLRSSAASTPARPPSFSSKCFRRAANSSSAAAPVGYGLPATGYRLPGLLACSHPRQILPHFLAVVSQRNGPLQFRLRACRIIQTRQHHAQRAVRQRKFAIQCNRL